MTGRSLATALALALLALPARAAPPPACPDARYAVDTKLLPAGAGPADGVEIAAGEIAIDSGCGPTELTQKGTKKGDKLSAKWKGCGGLAGKVKLSATLSPSCDTLTGTLGAAKGKPRFKTAFSAARDTSVRDCAFEPQAPTLAPLVPEPRLAPRRRPRVDPSDPVFQRGFVMAVWATVRDQYVTPGDIHGVDWNAVLDEYLAKVDAGLSADGFYQALRDMTQEIGDHHSHFLSPMDVAEEQGEVAGGESFAGLGLSLLPLDDPAGSAVVLAVFPNSPAALLGIETHDVLLTVDGAPVFDEQGGSALSGAPGSSFELVYQRPGAPAATTVNAVRGTVGAFSPIDHCMIPGTRILYLRYLSFLDGTADDRTRRLLRELSADEPLTGLIIDNRENPGGASSVLRRELALFLSGTQGKFVGPGTSEDLALSPLDVGGSQTLPLVVLAGPGTVSFAEVFTGVLQNAGRAQVVGETTAGNVEELFSYGFVDGSILWLAHATFQPVGLEPGVWEGVGIVPDVAAPGAWQTFTEANDPALGPALDLLPSQ